MNILSEDVENILKYNNLYRSPEEIKKTVKNIIIDYPNYNRNTHKLEVNSEGLIKVIEGSFEDPYIEYWNNREQDETLSNPEESEPEHSEIEEYETEEEYPLFRRKYSNNSDKDSQIDYTQNPNYKPYSSVLKKDEDESGGLGLLRQEAQELHENYQKLLLDPIEQINKNPFKTAKQKAQARYYYRNKERKKAYQRERYRSLRGCL